MTVADCVVTECRSGSVRVFATRQLTDRIEHKARAIAAGVDAEVLLSCCIIRRCRAAVERVDELRPGSCRIVRETVRVSLGIVLSSATAARVFQLTWLVCVCFFIVVQ